jgi:hypothetical protein
MVDNSPSILFGGGFLMSPGKPKKPSGGSSRKKPAKPSKQPPKPAKPAPTQPGGSSGFAFADPQPSPDNYQNFSKADVTADSGIFVSQPAIQKIPPVRVDPPVLSLSDVLPQSAIAAYSNYITFQSVGDTGGIKSPEHQFLVADKMTEDFQHPMAASRPAFFFHLGDVVYYFGQDQYFYDQFYDPYRNYPAPIFAIPGNHDAVTYPNESAKSLEAFQKHFCDSTPTHTAEAMGMARTSMTQPGVYFRLDAPFVRIIGLYSNTQEGSGQGIIADTGKIVGQVQKQFLVNQLEQAATDRSANKVGAVLIAVHHPPFTGSKNHSPSPDMLADIDDACKQASFVPDAIFSGHAHLYERYTRQFTLKSDGIARQVPFVVAGTGGFYNINGLKASPTAPPPRPPVNFTDEAGNTVTLENYLDKNFGFLRITVSPQILSCEFVGVTDATTPGQTMDRFTLDLASHKLTGFRLP